jgi:uncharacterized membrane protein
VVERKADDFALRKKILFAEFQDIKAILNLAECSNGGYGSNSAALSMMMMMMIMMMMVVVVVVVVMVIASYRTGL